MGMDIFINNYVFTESVYNDLLHKKTFILFDDDGSYSLIAPTQVKEKRQAIAIEVLERAIKDGYKDEIIYVIQEYGNLDDMIDTLIFDLDYSDINVPMSLEDYIQNQTNSTFKTSIRTIGDTKIVILTEAELSY